MLWAAAGGRLDAEIERRVSDLLPQAKSEAWAVFQSAPHALELEELVALAYKGLWEAATRWPVYCEQRGYSPLRYEFFSAYCMRRARGAMLDAMRSQDWLTRSMRNRAKAIRDAGAELGKSDAELAEATGLTVAQVREALAAQARRPQSFDEEPAEVTEPANVESDVAVTTILSAVTKAVSGLPERQQTILALRYYAGWDLAEVAEALAVTEQDAARQHAEAVDVVHQAMLRASV
jgi:RNA polymerase sigma factor FliA